MGKCFSFMPIPQRSTKPRQLGVTMMIDWGLGPKHQADMLDVSGEYVDIAKIAVGISGLIEEDVLKEKIATYKRYNILPFIGGQFLEFGIFHKGLDIARPYFEHALQIGFEAIEVSDNTLDIESTDKYGLINLAKEEYGLKVLGEVGSKKESSSIEDLVDGINGCLEAGAWKVFLEGAEFVDKEKGGLLEDVVQQVVKDVELEKLMFELPGLWIHNVHSAEIHDMTVYLIKAFGAEVNIANVMPQWVLELETLRRKVGVTGA